MAVGDLQRGAIVPAIAGYLLDSPFTLVQKEKFSQFDAALELVQAAQADGPALDLVAKVKVRPVLLLQDAGVGVESEYIALRLMRIEKFKQADRAAIRTQSVPSLFYLEHDPERYGLPYENAASLYSLLRIHRSTVLGQPLGALTEQQMRQIDERLVDTLNLDLSELIVREAAALLGD